MRHLISHSSGLRTRCRPGGCTARPTRSQTLPPSWPGSWPSSTGRDSEPGTRAACSNVGYLALGQVIAAVAGRPYEQFVHDQLFRPLGMT